MTVRNFQKRIGWVALALLLFGIGFLASASAEHDLEKRTPDLGDFLTLQVPAGHRFADHAYAVGVQVYGWNGTSWVFLRPEASLFSNATANGLIGTHYAGPTWESNSGSYVVGAVLQRVPVSPNAIPWLLLKAVDSDGPGVFDGVTYIQRVFTVGGLAPTEPGQFVGEEVRVPYTADYLFYKKHK